MIESRHIVLARRPGGLPQPEDFEIRSIEFSALEEGQVLVRNFLASIDPGMRSRLGEKASYAAPLAIGATIEGATVGEVIESRNDRFQIGDIVTAGFGWATHGLSDGRGLLKIEEDRLPYSTAIGLLGIPGLTSYFGLLHTGALKEGETVVVTSAAGTVGAVAGQIAKIKGATVLGIAGGPEKCRWLKESAGFDEVIDYKASSDLRKDVAKALPKGIDVLFDNVGNESIETMLPLMNMQGRIVVSGQVADYNVPEDERPGIKSTASFITHRLRMEGLVVFDYFKQFATARQEIADWAVASQIKFEETILEGLDAMPDGFIGLFQGKSFGRLLARLGADPEGVT